MHNETLSIVAMCVRNPDRSPVGINLPSLHPVQVLLPSKYSPLESTKATTRKLGRFLPQLVNLTSNACAPMDEAKPSVSLAIASPVTSRH